ncbi:serine/arginine-rich splicing factor 2-like [Diceros bicornis minor]|uniref:serine/arginine-rich splicing factor 2-like n=1 Tax=Diceros bicornis minor TaxID=77932 RepID=UPI0026EB9291|nr:serine/arginine-rich splicing factor 2-like [Diceros bicornis minor]
MSYGRPPPSVELMTSLKVDNINYRTSPKTLWRIFEKYGRVGDVYIPRDHFTKESRGFAFVRFFNKHHAEDAMNALDGIRLHGREVRVQMARYGRPHRGRYWGTPCRYKRHNRSLRRQCRSNKKSRSQSQGRSRFSHEKSPSRSYGTSPSTFGSRSTRRSKSSSMSRSFSPTTSGSTSRSLPPERTSKSTSQSNNSSKCSEEEGVVPYEDNESLATNLTEDCGEGWRAKYSVDQRVLGTGH